MSEPDNAELASSRSVRVAMVVGAVTVLWILAGLDRRYNRWERRLRSDISPLTRPRARMERVRVGIRDQRDVFGDLALLVSTVMQEVEAAREVGQS